MGVERKRLEQVLERALAEVRAETRSGVLRALLDDAVRVCAALEHERDDHTEYVLACRSRGMTLRAIAAELGLSAERVRAIAEVGRRRNARAAEHAAEGPITNASEVDRLDLPTRLLTVLMHRDIRTVGDLASKTELELRRLPHFGRASERAVHRELERLGFRR
jgi:hypothetical protein